MRGWFDNIGVSAWEFLNPGRVAQEQTLTMPVGTYTPATPEGIDAIERFKAAAQQFWQVFTEFNAKQQIAYASGNGAEWDELNGRASTAQSYIAQVGEAVSSAWGWGKQVFGLSGMRSLGLPIIPIAFVVVTAGLAWIVKITADMLRFNRRMDMIESGDLAPGEETGGSPGEDITSMLKWGIFGVAAVMVLPHVLKAWEKK